MQDNVTIREAMHSKADRYRFIHIDDLLVKSIFNDNFGER